MSSKAPRIEVLGIYRLRESDRARCRLIAENYPSLEPHEYVEFGYLKQLKSTVLIELSVIDRDEHFSTDDFKQKVPGAPERQWQVAWLETYLRPTGLSRAVKRYHAMPETGDLRIAFFVHDWKPLLHLHTSYGLVTCPLPQRMPRRLARLNPYEAPL